MPYELCEKIKTMTPYEPITGSYPVRLDANESFLQPDEHLRLKIMEAALGVELNRYPDALAKKVCDAFAHRFGVSANCVTAGNGSDELISVIIGSLLQKGETLLTLAPDFTMYRFYGQLQETRVVTLQKANDLTVRTEDIVRAANDSGARAIIFSNPCNPTSLVMSAEEVLALARATDALVVVDEAYMDFSDQSILCKAPELDNVIVLKTCSKAMGAAALRLGFAVANERLTNALRAAKSPYNADGISQAVGTVLLSEEGYMEAAVARIRASRDVLYEGLCRLAEFKCDAIITVYVTQTNFVLLRIKDAKACYDRLLEKGIVVRQLGDFLRITAGTEDENAAVVSALAAIL